MVTEDGSVDRGETTERRFAAADIRWRATVAWRAADGSALCYFRPEVGPEPGGDRPSDRRARLPADASLADLDETELVELVESAAPLTATERRFHAPDGRDWLAQNVGPVWADDEAAEGATGILFTALDGPPERLRAGGAHVGHVDEGRLVSVWRRAGDSESTSGDGAGGGGDGGDGG